MGWGLVLALVVSQSLLWGLVLAGADTAAAGTLVIGMAVSCGALAVLFAYGPRP